jgi:hypothetical protein
MILGRRAVSVVDKKHLQAAAMMKIDGNEKARADKFATF